MDSTYLSSDDSELLRKASDKYEGESCLEIGFGYGSNLLNLAGRFSLVVGTEVRRTDGFERIRGKRKVSAVLADRASCFKDGSFDLVLMNPPYLPSDVIEDLPTDGGRNGFEVPERFLEEAVRVLRTNGRILLVLSSETSQSDFFVFCNERNLSAIHVMRKPLFFEELTVFEIGKRPQSEKEKQPISRPCANVSQST